MRIRDWSSDVCSSDLSQLGNAPRSRPISDRRPCWRTLDLLRCRAYALSCGLDAGPTLNVVSDSSIIPEASLHGTPGRTYAWLKIDNSLSTAAACVRRGKTVASRSDIWASNRHWTIPWLDPETPAQR